MDREASRAVVHGVAESDPTERLTHMLSYSSLLLLASLFTSPASNFLLEQIIKTYTFLHWLKGFSYVHDCAFWFFYLESQLIFLSLTPANCSCFGLEKFHLPFKIQLNHFHLHKIFSQTLSILSFSYTLTTTAHSIINTFMLVFSYWGVVKGSSFY